MNTKKVLLALSVAIVLIAVSVYYAVWVGQAAQDFQARVELPAFSFTQINGRPFTRDSLAPAQPVVIMLFDPDCEHCQEELAWMQTTMPAFSSTHFLLVTPADRTVVIPFVRNKGLDVWPHARVLFTEPDDFLQAFGTLKMPSLYCYDRHHRLKKELHGRAKEDKLLEALKSIGVE
jgi:hypothetical protein